MELENIKQNTVWNDAAESINSNFAKIRQKMALIESGGGGPGSGAVDTAMSDTSENAVANKVIKAYVDAVKAELDAIVGGDATDAIESINEILAFLSTMADSDTLAGIVANLKKMIQEGDNGNIRYTDDAIAALKLYLDNADNDLDEKIGNLAEHIDAVDNTFIFSYDSTTNKATAEMVAGLASAITANKLIVCNGRVYKFILEQDGMYGLVSDAYMDITDGKLKTSILAVTASSYDVQLMEEEVPVGTEITEETVRGWGFTKNAGTITGIKMNGATKGTSGVVDLGNVLTEHQKLKTINNQSIVGSGNITIQGGGATERVEMTAESASIEPNKFYVWPMMDSLDVSLGAEQSGVMNRYLFQFRNPKAGVTILSLPDDITWSEDTELDENGMPVMEATAFYRIEIIEGFASLKKWKLVYINFADAEVERVLMANGVSTDDIGITKADAKKVTSLATWFRENKVITAFEELRFFKNYQSVNAYAFYGCTSIEKIDLLNVTHIYNQAFMNSNKIGEFIMPNVIRIEAYQSRYNEALKFIFIGDACENIANRAFSDCANTEAIVCMASVPPTLGYATSLQTNTCAIYVHDASLEAYKSANVWSGIATRLKGVSQLSADWPIHYEKVRQFIEL